MTNSLLTYFLEATIVSIVLFTGYRLIRETSSPTYNRFFLLACLLLMALFPLLEIEFSNSITNKFQLPREVIQFNESEEQASVPSGYQVGKADITDQNDTYSTYSTQATVKPFQWTSLIMPTYFIGVLCFLLSFLISLYSIYRLKRNSSIRYYENRKIFLVKNNSLSGASFFNFIFIGESFFDTKELKTIFFHELTHVKRLHSLDILLADIFRILFWFNPIVWTLRSQIRLTSEYEVDQIITSSFEKRTYANLLISLSLTPSRNSLYTSFSAVSLKSRLNRIYKETPNRRLLNSMVIFLVSVLSFWLVSCSETRENENMLMTSKPFSDVKTITTTFTSHQPDTQHKSDRVVAVAHFLPDQTLDRFEQHMSYPYDNDAPENRHFWSQPMAAKVQLIMDGLDLGDAENNLLYGNDWPIKFAELALEDHPKFANMESVTAKSEIKYYDLGYPSSIVTENEHRLINMSNSQWIEEFQYSDGKVTVYSSFYENVWDDKREEENEFLPVKNGRTEIIYEYDKELLTAVKNANIQLQFYYDNDQLNKSEFYVNGQLYNYRAYFYNSSGLKIRTEIFNVHSELEYTIHYNYEFFE